MALSSTTRMVSTCDAGLPTHDGAERSAGVELTLALISATEQLATRTESVPARTVGRSSSLSTVTKPERARKRRSRQLVRARECSVSTLGSGTRAGSVECDQRLRVEEQVGEHCV